LQAPEALHGQTVRIDSKRSEISVEHKRLLDC
jgi:hypothetical protein